MSNLVLEYSDRPSVFSDQRMIVWNDQKGDNVFMDAISAIESFFCIVLGCVVVDWYFRGVSERRFRQGLHAEAESYLRTPERI